MPSKFFRMSAQERHDWIENEAFIRVRVKFDPLKERRREQEVGATSAEIGKAIRRYWREQGNDGNSSL